MKPLIMGNWKMNKLISEAVDWVCRFKRELPSPLLADIVIIPPFTALRAVYDQLIDSPVSIGAQNVNAEPVGAFTGEISSDMLCEAGCSYVLIGHSERRSLFGETDSIINAKVRGVSKLNVIFCLGETSEQRKNGKTEETVQRQMVEGLQGVTISHTSNLTIAYEPIWAIGTGETASPGQAQKVHRLIRECLEKSFGNEIAGKIRILYGGSVNPENSSLLLAENDIDGLLVGGASLNVKSFCAIINSIR